MKPGIVYSGIAQTGATGSGRARDHVSGITTSGNGHRAGNAMRPGTGRHHMGKTTRPGHRATPCDRGFRVPCGECHPCGNRRAPCGQNHATGRHRVSRRPISQHDIIRTGRRLSGQQHPAKAGVAATGKAPSAPARSPSGVRPCPGNRRRWPWKAARNSSGNTKRGAPRGARLSAGNGIRTPRPD